MAKIKLTPAERMLVSIAETERQHNLEQINRIYQTRVQSLLETHELTLKDNPTIVNEGTDQYLTTVPLLEEK